MRPLREVFGLLFFCLNRNALESSKMQRLVFLLLFVFSFNAISAQVSIESHAKIQAALAERSYLVVANDLRDIASKDPAGFKANNYDYLSARISEQTGDAASAMASYQSVVNRGSVLKPYALWHLSRLARASGRQ